MTNQSFVDKYRPDTLDDVVGQGTDKVRRKAQNKEPVILYGPPGTGKTSTAEALAEQKGWNVSEINASSARTKADIVSVAQQIRMESIDGNETLIILDEIDSMDGRSLSPLVDVLEDPPNPIIATANELWKVPDSIENKCETYKFKLKKDDIKPFLKSVAQEESIDISSRQLGQLATREGLRDALNDLQEFSESGADTDWDERETEDSPFSVTERILRGKDYIGGQGMTPPDMVDFIDENVPGEFHGVELLRTYQALSEADKIHEKVNRTQDYSWWRYSGAIAEEVPNLRVTEPYDGWMNINYPSSRRVSSPYPSKDSPEKTLYSELKESEKPNYRAAFGFVEFKNVILPILTELPEEEKYQLILSESLSEESVKALDVSQSIYESWAMKEGGVDDSDDDEEVSDGQERSLFEL